MLMLGSLCEMTMREGNKGLCERGEAYERIKDSC